MGIILFPWQLLKFCPAHYDVHQEHHGYCADGMMEEEGHDQETSDGLTFKMLNDCSVFFLATEEFKSNPHQFKINSQQLAYIIAFVQLKSFKAAEQSFLKLPDQRSNSDPPLESDSLRGLPLV